MGVEEQQTFSCALREGEDILTSMVEQGTRWAFLVCPWCFIHSHELLSGILSRAESQGQAPLSSHSHHSRCFRLSRGPRQEEKTAYFRVQPWASACVTSHQDSSAVANFIKMEALNSRMQMGPLYYFLICLQQVHV